MQLNFSMRTTGVFPSMAIQMTAIGEESGALDMMLDKVATYYEAEVDNAVDGLTALMEPIIMSVLGVLVGGLVIAMYLPIFQLGKLSKQWTSFTFWPATCRPLFASFSCWDC